MSEDDTSRHPEHTEAGMNEDLPSSVPSVQNETPFEQAIRAWSEIGLTALQKKLDDESLGIIENQKASLIGRKELASKTKAFRKLADSERLNEIKGLLKMYQVEIDSLTSRSKFAETAFLTVYQAISEAPDPKPLLEVSIDSVHSASEASRLASENARLLELISKHADYDHIKAKLLKLEQSHIENAHAKVSAKEEEMNALMDEKERSWKLREAELVKQIEELKATGEVTQAQLVNGNMADESISGGRIAELELVARDLERANTRVLELERRNLELRGELQKAASGEEKDDINSELERKANDMEGENMLLAAEMESVRAKLAKSESDAVKSLSNFERQLSIKSEEVDILRTRLKNQEDYEELKRELSVLKSIELSVDLDDDDGDAEKEKLEKLLLSRNRKLGNDLTELRVACNELTLQVQALSKQNADLETEYSKSKSLNEQLEKDLMLLKETSTSPDAISTVSGWNWSAPTVKGRAPSPTSSIIGGSRGEAVRGHVNSSENSILPIITQQRDRFRARNVELESEIKKSRSQLSVLRKEIEKVKKDNLHLYEQSRYANSFQPSEEAHDVVEDRYKSIYEEELSPFQKFKGQESERALLKMNALERVAYSFTRVILANRISRNLFVIYCTGLHVLVMLVVMHATSVSTEPAVDHGSSAPKFEKLKDPV